MIRDLTRRLMLALGRRPAYVVATLKPCRGGAALSVRGAARWWASEEDVRAELARAWGAARRAFRRRHGADVHLAGALNLTREWEWRGL